MNDSSTPLENSKTLRNLDSLRDKIFSDQKPKIYDCGLPLYIEPQTITVIAAPPGWGKSSLVSQLAFDILRLNPAAKILIANVEMTFERIVTRELARLSNVPLSAIRKKTWNDEQKQKVQQAYKKLETLADRFEYMDMPFDLEDISNKCYEFSPDVLIIDYLQLVKTKKDSKLEKRHEIEAVMSELRHGANELEMAIILVSAVNRSDGYEGTGMHRMKDSGSIEYAIDDGYSLTKLTDIESPIDYQYFKLHHEKYRNQEERHVYLNFFGKFQRFEETPMTELNARKSKGGK